MWTYAKLARRSNRQLMKLRIKTGGIDVSTVKVVLPDDTSLTAFYRDMNDPERRTFWACATGWALDGMDFMIYPLVIGTIIAIWKVESGMAGLAGTATLLASAVGGWLAGYLCDRIGRVLTLQITILWFSVFSLVCAFVQDFNQLLIARTLLGLGFGGEWAVGSVLMGEAIRARFRGKAVGTVQGGWAIGWGITAISYTVLFSVLPADLAWRAMFWIGILPALLVFYIRRNVPEPEVFSQTRAREVKLGEGSHFLEIFSPALLRTTLLTALLSVGAQGGYYAITTWLPTFLKTTRGLSVLNTGGYFILIIAGSFTGYMTSAWMADGLGRKWTLVLFAAFSLLTVADYTHVSITNSAMLVLGFPLGFFASGCFSPMGAFFTELFPSRSRGSGQGFSYNFGRGIGALFPTLVGYLSARISLGYAISAFASAAYLVMIFAVLLLPETKGKELRVYE